MIKKVEQTIKKFNLIDKDDKIVIGVSGGPDSMCLLNVLYNLKEKLGISIVVAHINHMIREEAEEETKYVENYCLNINVPCFVKRIDVTKKSVDEKIGTEEAGRKARYDFFGEVAKQVGANKIATAHNANDNAETILMNIFRGAGSSGLKGIEPIRDGKLIRPLIECERNEIERYCDENKLNPKIDKSNFENVYTRNKIRNIIIPQLKEEFNPNLIQSINKMSALLREENDFIEQYVDEVWKTIFVSEEKNVKEIILDLKKINRLNRFIKSKIILLAIKKVTGSTQGIEKIHVDDIIKLCEKNVGNKYLTPNKNIKIYVGHGKVTFMSLK
ncbi:MAG: tRNA lysidine(34) synthetase TilS [Clostridia bacterium]|nr:tRNA lysidine(34) synthetase TilS [Clostridia bacterium]